MKPLIKFVLAISLVVVFLSGLVVVVDWYFAQYDDECLINFAKGYCIQNNFTYKENSLNNYGSSDFICLGEKDLRKHTSDWKNFYFLDDELNECIIKDSKTFKKGVN